MWIDYKNICKSGKTYCKTKITTMMPTFEVISDKYNIGFVIYNTRMFFLQTMMLPIIIIVQFNSL